MIIYTQSIKCYSLDIYNEMEIKTFQCFICFDLLSMFCVQQAAHSSIQTRFLSSGIVLSFEGG